MVVATHGTMVEWPKIRYFRVMGVILVRARVGSLSFALNALIVVLCAPNVSCNVAVVVYAAYAVTLGTYAC